MIAGGDTRQNRRTGRAVAVCVWAAIVLFCLSGVAQAAPGLEIRNGDVYVSQPATATVPTYFGAVAFDDEFSVGLDMSQAWSYVEWQLGADTRQGTLPVVLTPPDLTSTQSWIDSGFWTWQLYGGGEFQIPLRSHFTYPASSREWLYWFGAARDDDEDGQIYPDEISQLVVEGRALNLPVASGTSSIAGTVTIDNDTWLKSWPDTQTVSIDGTVPVSWSATASVITTPVPEISIESSAASLSIDGTLPVDVVRIGGLYGKDLEAVGSMFSALLGFFSIVFLRRPPGRIFGWFRK